MCTYVRHGHGGNLVGDDGDDPIVIATIFILLCQCLLAARSFRFWDCVHKTWVKKSIHAFFLISSFMRVIMVAVYGLFPWKIVVWKYMSFPWKKILMRRACILCLCSRIVHWWSSVSLHLLRTISFMSACILTVVRKTENELAHTHHITFFLSSPHFFSLVSN